VTVAAPAVVDAAFAAGAKAVASSTLVPGSWLRRIARVRDGARRLVAALTYAEALETGATLAVRVGQLPAREGDAWAPLARQTAARLSLVAHMPSTLQFSAAVAGLVVDEWVEVVPSPTEVTGLAFHYDRPSAEAPQAVLLAVAPDVSPAREPQTWDLDTLTAVLLETLDLARIRAVAPDDLVGTDIDAAIEFGPEPRLERAAAGSA